jgi:hypothetical protein
VTFRVESEVHAGEASTAGVAVARRLGALGGQVLVGAVALALAAGLLGDLLAIAIARLFRLPNGLGVLLQIGLALGLLILVGLPAYRRARTIRYHKRLAQWGTAGSFPASYQITDSAFVYSVGGVTKLVQWPVVSELFRAQDWWVLMAQGEPYYIPSRAFGGTIAERAFLNSMLDHMSDAARQRSWEAVAFLERAS